MAEVLAFGVSEVRSVLILVVEREVFGAGVRFLYAEVQLFDLRGPRFLALAGIVPGLAILCIGAQKPQLTQDDSYDYALWVLVPNTASMVLFQPRHGSQRL